MSNLIQITEDQTGKEIVMVRVDKTLNEMMTAKPYSRLSVDYWHPQYDEIYKDFTQFEGEVVPIKEILKNQEVISCDHVRASRGEKIGNFDIAYFTVDFILPTGYDITELVFASENAYSRLERSSLSFEDVAISGSGKGSVGKSFLYRYAYPKAIVGDLFILRPIEKISPYYLQIFMLTKYGKKQIQRHESGVSGQTHINKQEIEHFLIPVLKEGSQKDIAELYSNMSIFHDKAMEAKKRGKEDEYKNNLETAERLLKDLISKTEAVIRGEREDVV